MANNDAIDDGDDVTQQEFYDIFKRISFFFRS